MKLPERLITLEEVTNLIGLPKSVVMDMLVKGYIRLYRYNDQYLFSLLVLKNGLLKTIKDCETI